MKAVPPAKQLLVDENAQHLELKLKGDSTFAVLMSKLRKKFSSIIKDNESFIFYVGNNFAVCPNTTLKDVYDNFNSSGKLVLNYSLDVAWG